MGNCFCFKKTDEPKPDGAAPTEETSPQPPTGMTICVNINRLRCRLLITTNLDKLEMIIWKVISQINCWKPKTNIA